MTLKQSDIEALVQLFSASDWSELHLKHEGDELFLSKDASAAPRVGTTATPAAASPAAPATAPAPAAAPAAPAAPAQAADRSGWVEIKAPNLGTFYRSPSPDAAPYVTEGAQVTEETEICLVEVMKLFTTIQSGVRGTVREIVARDGEMVEFGATLMWIEPEA